VLFVLCHCSTRSIVHPCTRQRDRIGSLDLGFTDNTAISRHPAERPERRLNLQTQSVWIHGQRSSNCRKHAFARQNVDPNRPATCSILATSTHAVLASVTQTDRSIRLSRCCSSVSNGCCFLLPVITFPILTLPLDHHYPYPCPRQPRGPLKERSVVRALALGEIGMSSLKHNQTRRNLLFGLPHPPCSPPSSHFPAIPSDCRIPIV
jgi:hypothetical protein